MWSTFINASLMFEASLLVPVLFRCVIVVVVVVEFPPFKEAPGYPVYVVLGLMFTLMWYPYPYPYPCKM
jgi:hypothetical protein